MARKLRFSPGGLAYHVMNRAAGALELFQDAGDYLAFEKVLDEALGREPSMRLCAYCLMPNHFHLVLWPRRDGQLSRFMQWVSMTHAARWHAQRRTGGRGHLYQSRFKSFVVQQDEHFLQVCRYVERNPLRANLVDRAAAWQWSSCGARGDARHALGAKLARWPVDRPGDWPLQLNRPQAEAELAALRRSRDRGCPYGSDRWALRVAKRLGVESSLRPIGRPTLEKKRRK